MHYLLTRALLALALSTVVLALWGSTTAATAPRGPVPAPGAPAAVAGAGTLTPTPSATPVGPAPCGWAVVPSANVGPDSNHFNGVAMAAPNAGWAVGYYYNGGNLTQTLLEYWDGTTWYDFPGPNPGLYENYLNAVTTVSATEAWAAGYYYDETAHFYQTLIAHWLPSQWTISGLGLPAWLTR
jgi:hypothetical protein